MECKIILRADSQLAKELGFQQDVVFDSKEDFLNRLNTNKLTKHAIQNLRNVPGVSKMATHLVSNVNAGIQQDATHSTQGSNVILPSQMFNAFTFKGYSQREVNEIYNAIADIAVRGLSDTFFADDRRLDDIVKELTDGGMSTEDATTQAKTMKAGENIDFSQLVQSIQGNDNKEAKEKMLRAFREILLLKKDDENAGLFEVLVETFDAMGLPIDNPHMFNAAVSELANKFTKEAIKIKFDGQFAVLKPGSGSQQVYEITGGRLPYKDGMTVKYRPFVGTKVVTRKVAEEWARANGKNINEMKPRNLRGQYVTMVHADGTKSQLSLASGDQLIPEAKALSIAKGIIDDYKKKSDSKADHEALYKEFASKIEAEPEVMRFIQRYIDAIPESNVANLVKSGDPIGKIFLLLNPEAKYFDGAGAKVLAGDNAKLLYLSKLNTVGKVLTHELNNFMTVASQGAIPESLGEQAPGAKIEISRAEVIVDLTARDKFLLREGDDINDIDEEFFFNRLGDKAGLFTKYYGGDRMIQSGEQKIIFHYGVAPNNTTLSEQAEENPATKSIDIYGTDAGGTGRQLLFSLKNDGTTVHTIDGNMHIYLGNRKAAKPDQIQQLVQGTADSNYKRVADFLSQTYKIKEFDLSQITPERRAARTEEFRKKAKEMNNSWQKYLDVIGTRIPGQHYQSFQGLRIVGFATGNKIFVPNEITMLAGSDFDIDKMNMIYYSVDNDGTISRWHPAMDYTTKENLELSMRLPLPTGRKSDYFLSEQIAGQDVDATIMLNENADISKLSHLVAIYDALKLGKKLPNTEQGKAIAEKLVAFDDKTKFKVTPKGINNFTISRANAVINNPKNYPLLQKPVSMASPQLMGGMSKEGKEAKSRSKEQPSSIVYGKFDNMVGKDMIGIAASGLKAFSGATAVYNRAIMDLSDISQKRERLMQMATYAADRNPFLKRVEELNAEAELITNGFPPEFSLANVNFENAHPDVVRLLKTRFKPNNNEELDIAKQYIIQNMMEGLSDDAAEIDSELLSAATDNAKELILSKIRATPEFGSVYTALISQGVPFWKIVQTMTSPVTDYFIKHFNNEAFNANKLNFDTFVSILEKYNGETDVKAKNKHVKKITEKFKMSLSGGVISDGSVNIPIADFFKFNDLLKQGKAMQILGKYLSINQGIKAKAFELYSFTKTIESHIYDNFEHAFSFSKFLNSLNGDKEYANTMIRLTNKGAFNLLFVLSKATNFEKQLQGFNTTNQMLRESTYKLGAAYAVTNALEGKLLRTGGMLKEDQFDEVQRFVDNTVLLQFFNEETRRNNDPKTRPVFYDGDNRIELTTVKGRNDFATWVHDKFIPSVKKMKDFENNEFIRDLTYETVSDYLNSEPVPIVRMTYDTTNAIAEETKSKADNYKFHLNELRYGFDQDPNEVTTNNIFNVLFWYNTLINKGGTGKYSWAKMQNELILDDASHPFRRLAQLQGELGKNTSVRYGYGSSNVVYVNDIPLDIMDLMSFHKIKEKSVHVRLSQADEDMRRQERGEEPEEQYEEDQVSQSDDFEDDEERLGFASDYVPLIKVFKTTRKGEVGTQLLIQQGDDTLAEWKIETPSITIPYDINRYMAEGMETRVPAEDSSRAIREVGSRLQDLNPDIALFFRSKREIVNLSNAKKFDYTKTKAFILNGQVNINLANASISDVVHEYGHLFLHALKYESVEMYNNLIQMAVNHPEFDNIKAKYPELESDDLNEEVFINLFGTAMQKNLTEPKIQRAKMSDTEFAIEQINGGYIAWNGDMQSPRPVLNNIEWKDIRKGSDDLLAGKMTAAAKRLVASLAEVRAEGEYKFVEGSGKITQNTYIPVETADSNEEATEEPKENADNKELILNFADYSKGKIKQILSKDIESILDLSPKEVMNLSLEDAINLIGDEVMKNRIDNIYSKPIAAANEIAKLKDDLIKLGLLEKNCG